MTRRDFAGKSVVITGAAGGLGRSLCLRMRPLSPILRGCCRKAKAISSIHAMSPIRRPASQR